MRLAPGATPAGEPIVVPPATTPATCVPLSQLKIAASQFNADPAAVDDVAPPGHRLVTVWPSYVVLVEKHASAMTLPERKGCVFSMPVSSTATTAPVPS